MPVEEEPGTLLVLRPPPDEERAPDLAQGLLDATNTDSQPTTTLAVVNAKRKRGASSGEENSATPVNDMSEEEKLRRRKEAMQAVSADLLRVLKEYDTTPSILSFSISSVASSENQVPPTKKAKLSTPVLDTIQERLEAASYTSLKDFLTDVANVCRAVMSQLGSIPKGSAATSWENSNSTVARVIHFEQLSKDLVNRQRKRLTEVLDFTEEVDVNIKQEPGTKNSDKVALTVLTYSGPMFSSLPKPENITVPSAASSRSSSTTGSPKSPVSTAATSVEDFPRHHHHKSESVAVTTPFVEPAMPLQHVSTVKTMPAEPKKENVKVPKLGEVFPPIPALINIPIPTTDYMKVGLKWGGGIGPGGLVAHPEIDYQTEIAGHWLQYSNWPQPYYTRIPPDPFKQGIGLPADFVAAYSSFAPTKDESLAKVPSDVANSIWWERRGGRVFQKKFGDDPFIGHMHKKFARPRPTQETAAPPPPPAAQVDEAEIESLIESMEDLPIDTRLLMSQDAVLSELSGLLTQLQTQQYQRLATMPANELPATPEVETYLKIKNRLAELIDTLPPHVVATIDGNPDSDLILSSKVPILDSTQPIFRGTLPADDKPPHQVQTAAVAAMNAAAGLSPISASPVPMHQQPHRRPPPPQHMYSQPMPPVQPMPPMPPQMHHQPPPPMTPMHHPAHHHGPPPMMHTPMHGPPPMMQTPMHHPPPPMMSPMHQPPPQHYPPPPPHAPYPYPGPPPVQHMHGPPPMMHQPPMPPMHHAPPPGPPGPPPQYYGPPPQHLQHTPHLQHPQTQGYQRPRGSVPPPQGLGAIGVGAGYYQTPPPQMQGQGSPPGRFSQRVRR